MVHLVLYFSFTDAFIVPGSTISKVYANTMLMILNNRLRIIGGRIEERQESNEDKTDVSFRNPTTTSRTQIHVSRDRLTFRLNDISLRTDVERHVDFDPACASSVCSFLSLVFFMTDDGFFGDAGKGENGFVVRV